MLARGGAGPSGRGAESSAAAALDFFADDDLPSHHHRQQQQTVITAADDESTANMSGGGGGGDDEDELVIPSKPMTSAASAPLKQPETLPTTAAASAPDVPVPVSQPARDWYCPVASLLRICRHVRLTFDVTGLTASPLPISNATQVCPRCSLARNQPFRIITSEWVQRASIEPDLSRTLQTAIQSFIPITPLRRLIVNYLVYDSFAVGDVVDARYNRDKWLPATVARVFLDFESARGSGFAMLQANGLYTGSERGNTILVPSGGGGSGVNAAVEADVVAKLSDRKKPAADQDDDEDSGDAETSKSSPLVVTDSLYYLVRYHSGSAAQSTVVAEECLAAYGTRSADNPDSACDVLSWEQVVPPPMCIVYETYQPPLPPPAQLCND